MRRADDGLDRPPLPLSSIRQVIRARLAVHRNGHHRRAAPRRRRAPSATSAAKSIRSRCSSAAASRPTWRACAQLGEKLGLRRNQPQHAAARASACRSGAFGACLMAEPQLVADCVKAMRDAVAIPVTVKHRIGIDQHRRLRVRARFRRHRRRGGLPHLHRPCPQCRAERALARRRTARSRRSGTTTCTG